MIWMKNQSALFVESNLDITQATSLQLEIHRLQQAKWDEKFSFHSVAW